MSEENTNISVPLWDLNIDYQMIQSCKTSDVYFIQNNSVFDHNHKFKYSLKDNLKPAEQANNNGYTVQILETPIPFTEADLGKKHYCPSCDYEAHSRWQVDMHVRKHHLVQGLKALERKLAKEKKACNTR